MRRSTDVIPPRVEVGDVVAIVSPSSPGISTWPHRAARGLAYLESLGLRTRLMPNATRADGWVSASPQARADDINTAFADPEVTVVLTAMGGNHSNQLLPHLDYDLIRSNPKIFQGYSDATVLCLALLKYCGLRTFYGPALLLSLAEYPAVMSYTDKWLRAAWFGSEALSFHPAEQWTDERLDFDRQADLQRARGLQPSPGWRAVREGSGVGRLVGGCFETFVQHVKGSSIWPELDSAVLFLEVCENSPAEVDAYLTDLAALGVFDQISALLMGRPYRYGHSQTEVLWNVVEKHTARTALPVLVGFDCGHTDPILTLPLGGSVRVDAGKRTVTTLDAPTAPREGEEFRLRSSLFR